MKMDMDNNRICTTALMWQHTVFALDQLFIPSMSLSLATVFALDQVFIPSLSLSVSTLLLQVVFGCSTFIIMYKKVYISIFLKWNINYI
jgi:hypothetical protein